MRRMRAAERVMGVAAAVLLSTPLACSDSGGTPSTVGAGGGSASGGTGAGPGGQPGSGGAPGTGGSSSASGGADGSGGTLGGSGGTVGAGGTSGSGGTVGAGGTSGSGGTVGAGGTSGAGGATQGTGGGTGSPTHEDVSSWIDDYKAAHPGNGGKDWDINGKTPAQIAADPDAQRLLSLCGENQRPVIPQLAWEYGGGDHQWIAPEASPLVLCVYIPVSPSSEHWQYDAINDHVSADVYVLFPDENPCAGEQGADQVAACIGDATNFEILVDTASLNAGVAAGLDLSEASTDLQLILPDGNIVHLHFNA